jgi:hypothetical protein
MSAFTFAPLPQPRQWQGRYCRIPGKQPAFHVSPKGYVYASWEPHGTDTWISSHIVSTPAATLLARTLISVKTHHCGNGGGSFLINEYGQVLCPIQGTSDRYWVGDVSGVPQFKDPRRPGAVFDLAAEPTAPPGQLWDRPYIGMWFNLDFRNRIRFEHTDHDTTRREYLPHHDAQLVTRLRGIRNTGQTIRFIVNSHGVVLTKVEPDYHPVFVGHINPALWFPKTT